MGDLVVMGNKLYPSIFMISLTTSVNQKGRIMTVVKKQRSGSMQKNAGD
jgi:hypothetical protein